MTTSVAFSLDLDRPSVTILVTIAQPTTVAYRYVRQTSSLDCYAHLILQVEPYYGSDHILVEWHASDDELFSYFPAIVAGIKAFADDQLSEVEDPHILTIQFKVTVVGGTTHPVDSRESCFRIAAFGAMKQALEKGGRIALARP
jgi:elongation factor G